MSVEGHARIQDYFCGFKYGSDVAVESGKRDLITVPILLPEPLDDTPRPSASNVELLSAESRSATAPP